MDVERVVVRLFADAAPYTAALKSAESALTGFAGTAGMIGRLLDAPIKVAAVSAAGLTAAFVASGYAAVKLASNYEMVGVALEVMTGSAERGKKLLKDINDLAVATPFKSSGLQTAAKELAAFGIDVDQIMPSLKVLGEVASGVSTGNLDEMMGRIVLAFGQVRTAGRLMGPEARQFVQAGVPIYDYLAKTMGQPVERMKRMVEEGKVGFADVTRAFNAMTAEGGRFFGMMDKASQTVTGRWSAMIETLEIGLRDIGLAAFEGLGVKDTLVDLQKFFAGFQGDNSQAVNFFRQVRGTFEDMVRAAKLTAFWIDRVISGTRSWARENAEVLERIGKILIVAGGLGLAIVTISAGVLGIKMIVLALLSPVAILAAALITVGVALDQIGALDTFGQHIGTAMKVLGQNFAALPGVLRKAFENEDWESVGKLIGGAFKAGFMTFIHALGVEMLAVLMKSSSWVALNLEKKFKELHNNLLGLWDFIQDKPAPDRQKGIADRQKDIETWYQQATVQDSNDIKLIQKRLMSDIKQYSAEFQGTIAQEYLKQQRSDYQKLLSSDRQFAVMEGFRKQADELIAPFFGKSLGPAELAQLDVAAKKLNELQIAMVGFAVAMGAVGSADLKKAADSVARMLATPSSTPESQGLAADIRREMAKEQNKGIGFGAGQFSSFMKTMGLLEEGRYGPLSTQKWAGLDLVPLGGAMRAGMRGELTDDQYKFGMYREFQNLRRWTGVGEDRRPPTAMMGSTEAQDIINRSQMGPTDKMEEMIQVLRAAQIIEEEQKKILETDSNTLIEILKRMGGGAFQNG